MGTTHFWSPAKKAKTLLAAAALCGLCCLPATAGAVEFKIKGVWVTMFEYGDGGNFVKKNRNGRNQQGWVRWNEDRFEAKNRVRLQLEAVASENLSGTVNFEIGTIQWGRANRGGALGADSTIVKIKHSYLDWTLPTTSIRTRMGIQRIFLPDFVTEASQVFDADTAGISLSVPFNEHVSLAAFWARLFNDNWDGNANAARANYLDNADLFGLTLPLRFEGFRLTPWAMVGAFGANAFRTHNRTNTASWYYGNAEGTGTDYGLGLSPSAYANDGRENVFAFATAFWAGLTGELTAADPFRLAWSFNYGTVNTGENALNRHGWYAALLAEYKFDWGTPGIYGWYSSGDDDDPANGSERLPNIEKNNESTSGLATIATLGTWTLGRDAALGSTLAGTWGLGLRLRDFSVLDRLKHTLHVNYYQGTNSSGMVRYIKGAPSRHNIVRPYGTDFNSADYYGLYLTDKDRALEVGLMSQYQIYENLRLLVEANYIALWLDQSSGVWGGFTDRGGVRRRANSTEDLWNVNLSFIYRF